MLRDSDAELGGEFLKHMEQSVEVYKELAQLTDRTYRNANDLMGRHWKREGLAEFRSDLAGQQKWLAGFRASLLPDDPDKTTRHEPTSVGRRHPTADVILLNPVMEQSKEKSEKES
jgi:hypothetical protein